MTNCVNEWKREGWRKSKKIKRKLRKNVKQKKHDSQSMRLKTIKIEVTKYWYSNIPAYMIAWDRVMCVLRLLRSKWLNTDIVTYLSWTTIIPTYMKAWDRVMCVLRLLRSNWLNTYMITIPIAWDRVICVLRLLRSKWQNIDITHLSWTRRISTYMKTISRCSMG